MTDQTLTMYVKQAKAAAESGDYKTAYDATCQAAKCALLLAKRASGKEREEYFEKHEKLKVLLDGFAGRISKTGNKSINPAPATPPQSEVTPVVPVKPEEKREYSPKPQGSSEGWNPGNDGGRKPNYSSNQNKHDGWKKPDKSDQFYVPRKNDSLAPLYLKDYIGQPQAVTAVKDLITAAKLKNAAMPHIILYGSHGLGKTTFAKIIANEMKVPFREINVSKMTAPDMINILKKIKPREIIFIDEIHTLPLVVAESVLYSAMQDGRVTYTEGKGRYLKTETFTLPPFTLIGATTELGKLAKPFTQRAILIRLEEYTDEVLSGIISKSFYRLGMKITHDNALFIAQRCRNNPRNANVFVKRISDKALVRYAAQHNISESLDTVEAISKLNIEIEEKLIREFFDENGIDSYGLEKPDRDLLNIIIKRYKGGPVGIDTLARAFNESTNVISQKYEAYLIKRGMLRIDPAGRVAMPLAYTVLGLPVPENIKKQNSEGPADASEGENEEEKSGSKYERRKVIACKEVDELKAQKLDELMVFPEEAGNFAETNLDELFPDVTKPYDAETKHRCELEIDLDTHKRLIICDSFLESRFATCMAKVGYLHDIKAQTVELSYISGELANRRYFPDFVVKDYRDRIIIIEMKNYDMVSYHLNIDKYEELKKFCMSNGYGCAEIMKPMNSNNYISVEMLKNRPINEQLEQYIRDTIEKKGQETGTGEFTEEDFNAYKAENADVDKADVFTILLNKRDLKNVDRVGDNMKISLI